VPSFPRAIEEGIDAYLVRQAAVESDRKARELHAFAEVPAVASVALTAGGPGNAWSR